MTNESRVIECHACNSEEDAKFPVGYRGAGIETCPVCGSRNINIRLNNDDSNNH